MIDLFRLVQLYDFAAARDEIQWIRMEVRLLGDADSNVFLLSRLFFRVPLLCTVTLRSTISNLF